MPVPELCSVQSPGIGFGDTRMKQPSRSPVPSDGERLDGKLQDSVYSIAKPDGSANSGHLNHTGSNCYEL